MTTKEFKELKTEERKKDPLLGHPQNQGRSYPFPDQVIEAIESDEDIRNEFFGFFGLKNHSLKDFCYLGQRLRKTKG